MLEKKRDILIRRRHPMMIAILRGERENLPDSESFLRAKQGVLATVTLWKQIRLPLPLSTHPC